MAYVSHLRLTWGGVLGSRTAQSEIWSVGLALGAASSTVSLPVEGVMDSIVTRVLAYHGRPATGIAGPARVDFVTLAQVGPEGRVGRNLDGSFAQYKRTFTTENTGAGGEPVHPPQVAYVVSLQTARSGATGRGRIFLPAPTFIVNGTWKITTAQADGVMASTKTLLDGLNADLAGNEATTNDEVVCIASQGSVLQGLPPANIPVTSVRCGLLMDTMRSRRNALTEDYRAVALG